MWNVWAMKWNGQKVVFDTVNGTKEDAQKAVNSLRYRLARSRGFCQVGATRCA